MVMSVVMEDAVNMLSIADQECLKDGKMGHLLYADDSLLLGVDVKRLSRFLAAVSDAGRNHGMELRRGKLQLMKIRCQDNAPRPDGSNVEASDEMMYLGASIGSEGGICRKLVRRLGLAKLEFDKLQKLWKHSFVNQH